MKHPPSAESAQRIGVFDSGIGGLSILGELRRQLPVYDLLYVADQAHVPYGSRSLEEVRAFSDAISRYLISQGVQLVVVACNTASAAALHDLRHMHPNIPFVGMEPAVKPAAETTRSGVVGVLATPATFQGALYASVVERFANGVTLLQDTCPGLVAEIEAGRLDGPTAHRILQNALNPMLASGIDTIVLGCTHYPFVTPLITEIAGPGVRLVDPAPAVARQAGRVLAEHSPPPGQLPGETWIYTTGDLEHLKQTLPIFWSSPAMLERLEWKSGMLVNGK